MIFAWLIQLQPPQSLLFFFTHLRKLSIFGTQWITDQYTAARGCGKKKKESHKQPSNYTKKKSHKAKEKRETVVTQQEWFHFQNIKTCIKQKSQLCWEEPFHFLLSLPLVLRDLSKLVRELQHNGENRDFWETTTVCVLTQRHLIEYFFNNSNKHSRKTWPWEFLDFSVTQTKLYIFLQCSTLNTTEVDLTQHALTKRLQAGLDDFFPAGSFGEVSQRHHGFARVGLSRAGFVEPVRAAWGGNSWLGATSWSHSPWENNNTRELGEE